MFSNSKSAAGWSRTCQDLAGLAGSTESAGPAGRGRGGEYGDYRRRLAANHRRPSFAVGRILCGRASVFGPLWKIQGQSRDLERICRFWWFGLCKSKGKGRRSCQNGGQEEQNGGRNGGKDCKMEVRRDKMVARWARVDAKRAAMEAEIDKSGKIWQNRRQYITFEGF